jgi:hypothetical protein
MAEAIYKQITIPFLLKHKDTVAPPVEEKTADDLLLCDVANSESGPSAKTMHISSGYNFLLQLLTV